MQKLGSLPKMNRLFDIYWNENLVGALYERRGDKLVFQYETGYLSQHVQPVFLCLPLQAEPFTPAISRVVFEGMLPENEAIRAAISRIYETSIENIWGLISAIGRDCAGAISIVPTGERPPTSIGSDADAVDWLTESMLAEELANLKIRPLGAQNNKRRRISLAGYQEKMAVRINPSGKIGVPLDGAPSTHILKPDRSDFAGLAINEHFCMTLAARIGLNVAQTELRRAEDIQYLAVLRYDRRIDDQAISRIHQYDFCQAVGLPPYKKYEEDGGPSVPDCFSLLANSANITEDITQLIQALAFNVLIGNCDAHGKNYSFLVTNEGLRLAPLYDVFSTKAFPTLSNHLSMRIGDAQVVEDIRWRHWQKLASQIGIEFDLVQSLVKITAELMVSELPELLDNFRERQIAMEQPERIAAFARSQIAHVLDEAA
jgi:serine/threonine-protein kinase HipA